MKNKSELQYEVERLGIKVRNPYLTKEGLMDLLAVSHREHDVTGRPPLIPQLPVMLARNTKDLGSSKFDEMLENKNKLWIAEAKLDGVRAKLHLGVSSNRIDSRHRSDVTYEYVEKTDSLPHLKNMRHFMPGTVLDGELIMPVETITDGKTITDSVLTSTTATINSSPGRAIELQEKYGYCYYYVFDILFHRGEDVRQLPYNERYAMLCNMYKSIPGLSYHLRLPQRYSAGFTKFFEDLVQRGGEGIMLKRLDWPYESRVRSKGMFKLKKQRDLDCFITGFVPGKGEFSGLVGALLVSTVADVLSGLAVEVAAVQPGDLTFRTAITEADGSLRADMYNRVVEVNYLCKTKNNRLRHAVLKRFRPDKHWSDCKGD